MATPNKALTSPGARQYLEQAADLLRATYESALSKLGPEYFSCDVEVYAAVRFRTQDQVGDTIEQVVEGAEWM